MTAVNFNPIGGIWDAYVDGSTQPLSGRFANVEYQTIDEALTDPNVAKPKGVGDYAKKGHLWGAISAAIGSVFGYLYTKVESGFWKAILGVASIGNLVNGVAQIIVATVCKNPQEEKMKELIPKYITKENPSIKLEDVVLDPSHETQLKLQIEEAKKRGIVINIFGTIGIGKTMTGKAMAGELVKEGVCQKAQFWYAKDDLLKVESVDRFGKPVSFLGYTIIGGETIAKRIERVVANAIAHYKKTGEYVVVGLDEAHILLEGHDTLFNTGDWDGSRSSTKASDRPAIIQAFANMVEKIRDKNGDCKGVVLMLMSNSAGNKFKFLDRRLVNLEYKRPNAELREKFLRKIVPKYLENHGIQNVTINDNDYKTLAETGTENIAEKFGWEKHYPSSSTTGEYYPGYAETYKDELREFNLLHFDAIEKAIDIAAFDIKNGRGNGKGFVKHLKENLQALTDTAANDRKGIEDELKDRSGKDY